MGDLSQSVVFPAAPPADARRLGQVLLSWLVDGQVIDPELSDCVLGAPLGHPPGPRWAAATLERGGPFPRLRTHGVRLVTSRTVFDTGGLGFVLVCGACRTEHADLPRWGDAVGEWYADAGAGELACPACADTRPVTEWQHLPDFGFAHLGLTFWNWPPLADGFVQALGQRIGQATLVVKAKL